MYWRIPDDGYVEKEIIGSDNEAVNYNYDDTLLHL